MSIVHINAGAPLLGTERAGSMLVKRVFDITVATAALIVCLPFMALTVLLVYVAVGRPLMFRQERAGRWMRPFWISKFRTMTEARDQSGELLPDELRQTPMTVLIRRLRFDELPQLFAVIRGDMSFIGPRPLPIATLREFGEVGQVRCAVPPGMTGWAQVNGNTRLTADQKIALDIWYVDNHALWIDVWIVLLTLKTIIMGETLNQANIEKAQAHLHERAVPGKHRMREAG